jgi:hypothetical protein
MNLSIDQRSSLVKGEPVRVEENGLECVIVRADVFEQISNHGTDAWTPEEMRLLAMRTFEDADSAGPIP